MNAIEVLSQEHRMISVALDILEALASRLNAGEPVPNAMLADAVVFLREFADNGHRAKEEQPLFPMLVPRASGIGTNAISECIAQHGAARKLRQDLEWALESLERGEAGAAGAFVISARQYVQLLRNHMQLEDRYCRGPAKRVLSTVENDQLVEHMRAMDRKAAHASALQRFDRLVERSRRSGGGSTRP